MSNLEERKVAALETIATALATIGYQATTSPLLARWLEDQAAALEAARTADAPADLRDIEKGGR